MRSVGFYQILLLFALFIGLATGCKSGLRLENIDTKGFSKSSKLVDVLVAELEAKHELNAANCFEGKAKITVRTTEDNDTGTTDFIVCDEQAYFRIKNRLGIEGLRIWQQKDSLYIYDLIKKEAFALHQKNLVDPRLNALAAIDLFTLLVPIPKTEVSQLLESDDQFLLVFKNGQNWLFDKTTLDLATVIKPISSSTTDRIHFYAYAEQNGLRFPTKLALLNSTEQTNIFIQIQRLAASPLNQEAWQITIPESIIIQR
jgi:hypothetical protein